MKTARYYDALAEALILELRDIAAQDRALEELEVVWQMFHENPSIRDRVLHASTPLANRIEMLEKAVKEHVQPQVERTLLVLLREHALTQLPKFIERFKATRRRLELARDVVATSAIPLTDAEKKRLQSSLEKKWGLHVNLTEQVEPSIIGGLKLTAGDWKYDATVRGRLVRLSRKLNETVITL